MRFHKLKKLKVTIHHFSNLNMTATIIDRNPEQWYFEYFGVTFQIISIRQKTVLVKCCSDEPYFEPYNVHEFPKEAVLIQ